MGFWHTGYIEHHEQSGLAHTFVPTPIRYRCDLCEADFDDMDDLRRHRFEQHPVIRPALFVRGFQLGGTPFRIAHPSSPTDFLVDRVLRVEVNGIEVPATKLGKTLTAFTNDKVTVTLFNERSSATFEIVFNIASKSDLQGVETCFQDLVKSRHLDMRAIEGFIANAKQYASAIAYCDGICHYLYGVLAKERARDSRLEYAAYRDKFNQAADILAPYDRQVARHIRALVAFHFNHFSDVVNLIPKGRLAAASRRFDSWLKGPWGATEGEAHTETRRDPLEDMLTDFETSRILGWTLADSSTFKAQKGDVEAMVRQEIPAFDRVKLIMLLAEQCALDGEVVKARRYARELINSASTAAWAERLLERLPLEKRE